MNQDQKYCIFMYLHPAPKWPVGMPKQIKVRGVDLIYERLLKPSLYRINKIYMAAINLTLGILILLFTFYDFFFTTLSGGGAAFITKFVSGSGHKFLYFGAQIAGRNIYRLSGMVINLIVLTTWIILIWLGLYLVFSSNAQGIVNDNGRPADTWERIYYTGYTLSTLGLGNFKPVTPAFELLSSIFSFFGFIFFTASMTYFISVSSAFIHKRSLALGIRHMGRTPEEMVYRLLNQDEFLSRLKLSSLQEKIERHCTNLQAYPVLHYISSHEKADSINLNIAAFDETVSILFYSKQGEKLKNTLTPLRSSLTYFLNHIEQDFSRTLLKKEGPDVHQLPGWDIISSSFVSDPELFHRRKILGGLLKMDNLKWQDVYRNKLSS
jgi:hypothetical protein